MTGQHTIPGLNRMPGWRTMRNVHLCSDRVTHVRTAYGQICCSGDYQVYVSMFLS